MPPPSPPPDFLLPLDQLPDPLPIPPIERGGGGGIEVSIRPPGSKSITNRALLLAALADGVSTLRGALTEADDAQVMIAALQKLGAAIDITGDTVKVTGVAGRWKIAPGQTVTLDLHNAGTATRFLTAAAMLAPLDTIVVIDGDARMRQRPIAELVAALTACGSKVEYLGTPGCPPLSVSGQNYHYGLSPVLEFGRTASSQFQSALFMTAPFMLGGPSFKFTDEQTSEPYLRMTLNLMRSLGFYVDGELGRGRTLNVTAKHAWGVNPVRFPQFELDIEPDASGATYFEGAAAITRGSRVIINGLDLGPQGTLQGDACFVGVLTTMGCRVERGASGLSVSANGPLRPIDFDLSDMPDTAMTAAVLACFAEGTTTLRGLRTLRVKETDRLVALQTELTKLGAAVEIFKDGDDEGLRITPPDWSQHDGRRIEFDTYHDHRMAMALALIGLRVPGIHIRNPACVAKTYPTFWRDLAKLFG